jgi:hypothetical protein
MDSRAIFLAFDCERDTHAPADARTREPLFCITTEHFVQQWFWPNAGSKHLSHDHLGEFDPVEHRNAPAAL